MNSLKTDVLIYGDEISSLLLGLSFLNRKFSDFKICIRASSDNFYRHVFVCESPRDNITRISHNYGLNSSRQLLQNSRDGYTNLIEMLRHEKIEAVHGVFSRRSLNSHETAEMNSAVEIYKSLGINGRLNQFSSAQFLKQNVIVASQLEDSRSSSFVGLDLISKLKSRLSKHLLPSFERENFDLLNHRVVLDDIHSQEYQYLIVNGASILSLSHDAGFKDMIFESSSPSVFVKTSWDPDWLKEGDYCSIFHGNFRLGRISKQAYVMEGAEFFWREHCHNMALNLLKDSIKRILKDKFLEISGEAENSIFSLNAEFNPTLTTCDEIPLCGPISGQSNVCLFGGFDMVGLSGAYQLADCLVGLILDGHYSAIPEFVRPNRFRFGISQ